MEKKKEIEIKRSNKLIVLPVSSKREKKSLKRDPKIKHNGY